MWVLNYNLLYANAKQTLGPTKYILKLSIFKRDFLKSADDYIFCTFIYILKAST